MSVKKNFIYNVLYQILVMIIPLITTPYVARVIGVEGSGIQAYTLSIANYFVLFSMLGINNYGNRSIAEIRDNKEKMSEVFWGIYCVQFIMSTFMIIIYVLYVLFFIQKYKVFFLIQLAYIFAALLDINWFFFGIEQFKLTVIRNSIIKILSVISIFIFVKDSNDLYKYSLILAISNLMSQIVLWKFLGKYISCVKVKVVDIKKHIKPILILFIPVIAISIYKIMDKIMIGTMSNVNQVGIYENSEKIINIPLGVIAALATVMLPRMSNLQYIGDEEKSKRYIAMSMEFIIFIGFGSVFGLIGIGNTFIPMFLGEEFIQCINVVSLLAITIIFLAWANVIRTQYLIPKKKDNVYIISTILGAFTNLVINFLLIKKMGAIGAAIGTIFAEFVVAVYQTFMVRKELEIKTYFKRTIFYIIPGLIMCSIQLKIGNIMNISIFTGVIQVVGGGFIYCLLSLIYMIYIKNEIVCNLILKIKRKLNL